MGVGVGSLFCCVVLDANYLAEAKIEREIELVLCFNFVCGCLCSVSRLQYTMGWSAVGDCEMLDLYISPGADFCTGLSFRLGITYLPEKV